MIVEDVEQGTFRWKSLRFGIPTASGCARIITPTGRPSAQQDGYIARMVAEWITGDDGDVWGGNFDTERGRKLEGEARRFYAFQRDLEVRQVGFCWRDETKTSGCSPDGLVGDHGLLELKCPKASTHVGYLVSGGVPRKYRPQLQFQLHVTGRDWVDFVSYHPDFPPLLVREHPDGQIQAALEDVMPGFLEKLARAKEMLVSMGARPFEFDEWGGL